MSRSDDEDRELVQIDVYGIKVKVPPSPSAEADPRSWREVATKVNQKLMAITAGLFGTLDDTVKSVRSLVRGVGGISAALAEKIQKAHSRSDAVEAKKQAHSVQGSSDLATNGYALSGLEELLRRKWLEGNSVRILSDGQRTVLLVLKPTDEEAQKQLVQATLAALPEHTEDR